MPKILVVGDAIIDRYQFGTIDRVSPEDSSIDVFDVSNNQMPYDAAGGCLNVAANLSSISTKNDVYVATALSEDATELFARAYKMKFIDKCPIFKSEDLIKTRLVNEKTNKQILRIDTNKEYSDVICNTFETVFNIDEEYDAIVVSDYNKGLITNKVINKLAKQECPIFIDTKLRTLSWFRDIKYPILKLNSSEYAFSHNKELFENIIITRGMNGATWLNNGIFHEFETAPIKNGNAIGAGDVFLAGLVTEYLRSFNFIEAIKFANHTAYISVNNFGTYRVKESELKT